MQSMPYTDFAVGLDRLYAIIGADTVLNTLLTYYSSRRS
jgi:hypothetical protein